MRSFIAPSTITNFFVSVLLQEQDAREQDAGVADEHAAGLEQQLDAELLDAVAEQRIRIGLRARWLFVVHK